MSDQSTGSLIGGIFGGAIGFFLGGNVALGYAIGSAIGGQIGAANAPPLQGPRLQGLAPQGADYGASIPRLIGRIRVGGATIWAGPLNEHSHDSSGKGDGGPKTQSYSYTRSFAVALCEGEADVVRVWAAKKLIYDATSQDPAVVVMGLGNAQGQVLTVYRGSESQGPDPTIQAYEGAAPPAYLGTCYIVIHELDVTEYGGRLPPIEAEVIARPGGAAVSVQHTLGPYALPAALHPTASWAWPRIWRVNQGLLDLAGMDWYSHELPMAAQVQSGNLVKLIGPYPLDTIQGGPYSYQAPITGTPYGFVYAAGELYVFDTRAPSVVKHLARPSGYTGIWGGSQFAGIAGNAMFFSAGAAGSGIILASTVTPGQITDGQPAYAARQIGFAGTGIVIGTLAGGEPVCITNYGGVNTGYMWDIGIQQIWTGTLPTNWQIGHLQDGALTVVNGAGYLEEYDWTGSGWSLAWTSAAPLATWTSTTALVALVVAPRQVYVIQKASGEYYQIYTEDGISQYPALTLADLITTLALEAPEITAADIDVTACTGIPITGYSRPAPSTARDALSSALALYQVDCIESGGKLIFRPRAQAQTITVDPDDLGAHDFAAQDIPTLTSTRTQAAELPRQVNLHYLDPARDLQPAQQTVRRLDATEGQTIDLQYPGALDATEAVQRAEIVLRAAWRTRTQRKFALPHTYLAAEPGDVLAWGGYQIRITRIDGAVPGPLTIEGVDQQPADYTSYRTGSTPAASTTVSIPGPTDLLLLDIPALRDADAQTPGLYMAAAGLVSGWPGAAIERSGDGGASWSQIGVIGQTATLGVATTALADSGITTVFDRGSTITVRLYAGALSSATELQVLNGSNLAVLGGELIAYQTATLNADGTYTLSKLLRGLYGTEDAMGSHAAFERFAAVTSAGTGWLRQAESASLVGATLNYRGTTLGTYSSNADTEALVYAARGLLPYSPCHLKGKRASSGDLTITWVRRTRYQTNWKLDYCPLGETSELYDLEILNGATVVRTLSSLSSPTYTYTAADQTADFGAAQTAVSIRVYQRSAAVGRGTAAIATV
ncbi:phage tail protein [Acidihalobacter prosperus]|uniref:Uncharacterized protein n=1 Tax=Acidihalobacter prosperus TaxID=160660 RepID=A0A1A6C897_9GAMM|nr:phage tail protein [Acidihalobacter prosperus]OBS10775.1 hypothetical protein Thpro_020491 [Acidihalobacter prosperus]